jgi:hypothetical protein
MISILAALLLAQTVGGETKVIQRFEALGSWEDFGNSVATVDDLDGDGIPEVFIGAPHADGPNGEYLFGRADVYSGRTGDIIYQFYGDQFLSHFGLEVCDIGDVDGDGMTDLAVGAKYYDDGNGKVHVYSGATGNLIRGITGGTREQFGYRLSPVGDVNADHCDDFLVGAPYAERGAIPWVGKAYLISGKTGTTIRAWRGEFKYSLLGKHACGLGDVDQDGIPDIAIDEYGYLNAQGERIGKTRVLSGRTGDEIYTLFGQPALRLAGDIANVGDLDSDGISDWVHGSEGVPNLVTVFSGLDGGVILDVQGAADTRSAFGWAVCSIPDFDLDGVPDFGVGDSNAKTGQYRRWGAVYIYSGLDGALLLELHGRAANRSGFGYAIAGFPDLNGDGAGEIMIGDKDGKSFGATAIVSFRPILSASTRRVSIILGGTVDLNLDFPDSVAGQDYKIIFSQSGMGPSTYGVEVPLAIDSLSHRTFLGDYPMGAHSGMHGQLDQDGQAAASFSLPAGLPTSMLGERFHYAAVTFEPGGSANFSSAACSLTLVLY